ncbi:hypothetical protein FFLO_06948 [Filobasidium floriforme]|uniref:Uncharacterized protein n=1 Tax=Filobasidium floriforme TaxID=5210 RepID=A0A8K0JEF1_9TREE|nr:uncharacterized protein HD553DRAFT_322739 [Filobasidium floriforme]KAG7527427.1 hypothetical protein FFLO_06948 [Filobasidium floriforme]KAH8087230.1 hypothetical protein HD553DRAFT_322739 [Filobasidium floriforme]
MPRGFSKGLRETVSRIGKSIRRSNDEELPLSSTETPAGNSMALTNHSASTESIHTVPPTFVASDARLGDPSPASQSRTTRTTLYSQTSETFPENLVPSAMDWSEGSNAADPEVAQIKVNQVQNDPSEPLRDLLHEMKIFQRKDDTSGDAEKQRLREEFIEQLKRHYNVTHLSRTERPRYTKSPYKIQLEDLVPQELMGNLEAALMKDNLFYRATVVNAHNLYWLDELL